VHPECRSKYFSRPVIYLNKGFEILAACTPAKAIGHDAAPGFTRFPPA